MGANAINTALESLAPRIAELTGDAPACRILSNLADQRTATARCTIPADMLATKTLSGSEVAKRIEEANAFAVVDRTVPPRTTRAS
jgi:hydroxymethylglutaryl-CoA reductase